MTTSCQKEKKAYSLFIQATIRTTRKGDEQPTNDQLRELRASCKAVGTTFAVRMAAGRFRVGYPRVSVLAGSVLGMIFHPRFSGSVSGLVFHPWISNGYPNKSLELIFIFYNMIIITFYLDYEIYFKLTHENIYVLLPLVYTCKYVYIYL